MNYRPGQNRKALHDAGPPAEAAPTKRPARPRRLNPDKLLLSKWTAVQPRDRERHFLVTRCITPEDPQTALEFVEIEAVLTGRRFTLAWRALLDVAVWHQGWK
jgi:tryptophan-rich hypothetical protein